MPSAVVSISNIKANEVVANARLLATEYTTRFFADKEYCGGGKIPSFLLHNERNISLVMNTTIDEGMEIAYAALDRCDIESPTKHIKPEVRLVMDIINECSDFGIPQPFVAGIIIIYLELCTGIDVMG